MYIRTFVAISNNKVIGHGRSERAAFLMARRNNPKLWPEFIGRTDQNGLVIEKWPVSRIGPRILKEEVEMKKVITYTDGSCLGNPGPGGWAATLIYKRNGNIHTKTIGGGLPKTTNNRAELTAAINALAALKEPCVVDLYTDSQYLVTVATGGKARANLDLVTELRALMARHRVTVHHVKGHNGHPENNRVDKLARQHAEATKYINP